MSAQSGLSNERAVALNSSSDGFQNGSQMSQMWRVKWCRSSRTTFSPRGVAISQWYQ